MTVPAPLSTDVARVAARYQLPVDLTAAAALKLADGAAHLVGVSGKMASGKDTIAPLLMAQMGVFDAEHQSFAKPLKDELDQVFATIRSWAALGNVPAQMLYGHRVDLAQYLATMHHIPFCQALDFFAGDLADLVIADPAVHSRMRGDLVRGGLLKLGTEVRRAQDDLYWVKRAARAAVEAIASGRSVFFTDCRFVNEADSLLALGGVVTRLDVTPETQAQRMWDRDGLAVDPQAAAHKSELDLDEYERFTARVSNDGTIAETLAALRVALQLPAAVAA